MHQINVSTVQFIERSLEDVKKRLKMYENWKDINKDRDIDDNIGLLIESCKEHRDQLEEQLKELSAA